MPSGSETDIPTQLTNELAAILTTCKRIEPQLRSYLTDTDERPDISFDMLMILSKAIRAYELIQPPKSAAEFHGAPKESCSPDPEKLHIRHHERPEDWDFHPWLAEKLNAMTKAAKSLVEYWLVDPKSIQLHPEAPVTPNQWLKSLMNTSFSELRNKAQVVFEEVCGDKIEIRSTGS